MLYNIPILSLVNTHRINPIAALMLLLFCFSPAQSVLVNPTCQTNKSLSIPAEYQKVAEATGGSVFRLDEAEIKQLPTDFLIDITDREHILKITKTLLNDEVIELPIDSSINQLRLHISAQQPMSFELRTPDQALVKSLTADVNVQAYASGCVSSIADPAPGLWALSGYSSDDVAIDIRAKTQLAFTDLIMST